MLKKEEVNKKEVIGIINISKTGNIRSILKHIKINAKRKETIIIVEPDEIDKDNINLLKNDNAILIFSNDLNNIKKVCTRVFFIKDNSIYSIKTIKQLESYNYSVITITAKDVQKITLPLKHMVLKSITKEQVKFMYKGNINDLIKILSNYTIDKILIEDVKVEDIFNSCKEN